MIVIAPLLIPFATGIACVFFRAHRKTRDALSLLGSIALLVAASTLLSETWRHGFSVLQVGSWPAPFGITFAADLLSAIMVFITGFLGFAVNLFALGSISRDDENAGHHPLYHFLLMGVCGSFVTGDLFNLYVWFEVFLLSSFALLVLSGSRQSLAAAIKYFVLSLLGSSLFLAGLGLLYNSAGTLNMADLASIVKQGHFAPALPVALSLLAIAFMAKASVVPFHFWLPASYHTPSIAVAALFAGLLTKVGVYALIRMAGLGLLPLIPHFTETLLVLSAITMVIGVLGAASQMDMRRILSFHIISQIGYMTMGLALLTLTGVAGAIFYLIHHIVVKTNLFLVTGVIERLKGHSDLRRLGGMKSAFPWLAVAFIVPALSLAGLPPLSGFWAKLIVIKGTLEVHDFWSAGVALGTGLLTLFSMSKIWNEAFWKRPPEVGEEPDNDIVLPPPPPALTLKEKVLLSTPMVLFCLWTLAMGFAAETAVQYSERAAQQILDPGPYIEAVLGPSARGGQP